MEKGRKKETEVERGRERKIHIISTIRTFHSSRRYSTLHFFPLPSYLSLAFIFLSFFFFSFFLIYPRPFQRIISCAELLVPGVFSSPLPPHRRPPIDIFKRKAGTMRGFSCIIVASSEISFFLRTYNYAFLGKGKKKRDRERGKKAKKKNENRIDSYEKTSSRPLANTRKRATELN